MDELINADFTDASVIATNDLPWSPSPQSRASNGGCSTVSAARSHAPRRWCAMRRTVVFPAHSHALGEEFLVLDGVFSDEHGDYPAGTYVRNPPGSRHSPRTAPGCTILVKLRQMPATETRRVVIDTSKASLLGACAAVEGHQPAPLCGARGDGTGDPGRLEAGRVAVHQCAGGEEFSC